MDIITLIINVGVLFIMMVPGILLKKCNFVSEGFGKGISNLVLYIAQPSLIVYAYLSCKNTFGEIWQNCLMTFILSVIGHVIFTVVTLPLFRKSPKCRRDMLRFATIFSNAAFMGIPLIQSMLGPEAAIYASIYNITFNIFLWTLGVFICTSEDKCECKEGANSSSNLKEKFNKYVIKLIIHPVTLASVIGLVLLITGVNVSLLESVHLDIISTSLEMVSSLVAPLSMVVIGLRIPDISFKDIKATFCDTGIYLFIALRHFLLPLAVTLVMYVLSLLGTNISAVTRTVILILSATPAASSTAMFAEKYNCDVPYASTLVVISTVLSIASMPIVAALTSLLF